MIKKFRFLFVFASLGSILLISSAKQQNVALADIDAAAQAGYWNCWDDGTIDPCHRDFFDVSMISDSDG